MLLEMPRLKMAVRLLWSFSVEESSTSWSPELTPASSSWLLVAVNSDTDISSPWSLLLS